MKFEHRHRNNFLLLDIVEETNQQTSLQEYSWNFLSLQNSPFKDNKEGGCVGKDSGQKTVEENP